MGSKGEKWLDLISGIAVSNVGHAAPEVVKAIQDQSQKYLHTMVYGEYLMSPQIEFAQALVRQLDHGLDSVYFTNSGSEAVEGALKLAKKFTGRTGILSFRNSYHGGTHGALSVTGTDWIKEGYGPFLPEVVHLDFNNFSHLNLISTETACIVVEAIQAEAGVIMPREGFLEALRARCDETGTLLILDEIQTGMGRTGSLFAFQKFGLRPDILLLAKSLGGGMPIGAFISRQEIMQTLSNNPILGHITTFGGHPVCAAAGLAALNKILDEKLLDRVADMEALIRRKLDHPLLGELRGTGLLWSIEIGPFEQVEAVMRRGFEKGFIMDWFLGANDRMRLSPPLVTSLQDLEWGLDAFLEVVEEVKGQPAY